jgi:hypothetical protein
LIAIGLFVVSAVVTILDLELPHAVRDLFPRADRTDSDAQVDPDMRQTRAP